MLDEAGLLRLIDRLYEGAVDDSRWLDALGGVVSAFASDSAVLALHDPRSNEVRGSAFVETDPSYRRIYSGLVAEQDMNGLFRAMATNSQAGVLGSQTILRLAPQTLRSRFFAEWLRPQRLEYFMVH